MSIVSITAIHPDSAGEMERFIIDEMGDRDSIRYFDDNTVLIYESLIEALNDASSPLTASHQEASIMSREIGNALIGINSVLIEEGVEVADHLLCNLQSMSMVFRHVSSEHPITVVVDPSTAQEILGMDLSMHRESNILISFD